MYEISFSFVIIILLNDSSNRFKFDNQFHNGILKFTLKLYESAGMFWNLDKNTRVPIHDIFNFL